MTIGSKIGSLVGTATAYVVHYIGKERLQSAWFVQYMLIEKILKKELKDLL